MKTSIVWRAASLVTIALALTGQGRADTEAQRADTEVRKRFAGVINDYTATLDSGGPWHVSGEWSLSLEGDSGKGNFSAALGMVRAENPARAAHTHHVTLVDGEVTLLANGFRISGAAEITSNGNL